MLRGQMYRLIMLVVAGGMLFQTAGCSSQALDAFKTSVVPALTTALTDAIAAALQTGLAA